MTTYICFLDFSKAFDKINRTYLLEKLRGKLDDDLWLIIKKYYDQSLVCVENNKERSELFGTRLGVKQGGPMSPKLFNIYVDGLIERIIKTNLICSIDSIQTGVILYAEDTTIICDKPEKLQQVLEN